jgi:hypothetical protein
MPDPLPNNGGNGDGSSAGRSGPTDEGRGVARRLLLRFRGKAEDALAQLADENRAMRDERRDLRDKLKGFEGPDVVVLKGDDLKAYIEYKALGKVDDLKKIMTEELPGLRTKVTESERRTSAADAAKLLGWNPEATAGMIVDKQLEVSLVDGQDKDGKAIKIPHVRPASDTKAAPIPLAKWQADHASYLTPALTAKAGASTTGTTGSTSTTSRTTAQGATGGTPMIEQGGASAGTAPGTDAAKQIPGRRPYVLPSQRAAAAEKK